MKTKKSSYYKVGLGDKFLFRAKIIFSVILLLALGLSSAAVYAGITSGQLYKFAVEPLNSLAKGAAKTFEETTTQYPVPTLIQVDVNISNTKSTSNVEVNISSGPAKNNITTPPKNTYVVPTYPPQPTLPPQKNFEERVREMNEKADHERQKALQAQEEWSKQKRAENDAWFQQQVEESQKKLEEWKKQNGF